MQREAEGGAAEGLQHAAEVSPTPWQTCRTSLGGASCRRVCRACLPRLASSPGRVLHVSIGKSKTRPDLNQTWYPGVPAARLARGLAVDGSAVRTAAEPSRLRGASISRSTRRWPSTGLLIRLQQRQHSPGEQVGFGPRQHSESGPVDPFSHYGSTAPGPPLAGISKHGLTQNTLRALNQNYIIAR